MSNTGTLLDLNGTEVKKKKYTVIFRTVIAISPKALNIGNKVSCSDKTKTKHLAKILENILATWKSILSPEEQHPQPSVLSFGWNYGFHHGTGDNEKLHIQRILIKFEDSAKILGVKRNFTFSMTSCNTSNISKALAALT